MFQFEQWNIRVGCIRISERYGDDRSIYADAFNVRKPPIVRPYPDRRS